MIAQRSISDKRYRFTPTKLGNPCPICGKTNGSCSIAEDRINGQIRYFCISYPNGEAPGNYRFLFPTRDGIWGIYTDASYSNSKTYNYYYYNKIPFEKTQKSKKLISNIGFAERKRRDSYFKWLLEKVPLSKEDEIILNTKGLESTEIRKDVFGSIPYGILIVFKDVYGYKIGAQVRTRNTDKNGSRYVWYKSKNLEPKLPDGQMPIAVWRSKNNDNTTVCLCEGYLKSYIARQQFLRIGEDKTWIGFGSVSYLSSGFEEIKRTIKKLNPQEIIFYPDGNSANNKMVAEKYLTFWKDITQTFPDIKLTIASWQQEFNESEDIDEVDKSIINLFPYKEYINYFQGIKVYQREERLKVWQEACQKHKYILDSSPTGTGKSYDSGRWEGAAIYICNDHRNPPVETLKEQWQDVESRHGGLFIDQHNYLRRIPEDKENQGEIKIHTESNCYKHKIHQKLREKGCSSVKVCQKCELFQECQNGIGTGYGYLYQRKHSLMSNKIRIHPDSLPNVDKYDYKSKTIFIEEAADISLVTELKASIYHLDEYLNKIDKLKLVAEEKEKIKAYIEELKKVINNQRGKKYGTLNVLKAPQISENTQLYLFEEIEKNVEQAIEPSEIDDDEWEKAKGFDKYLLVKLNQKLKETTSQPEYIIEEIDKTINPILSWLLEGLPSWINNNGTISVFRPKVEIQKAVKAAKNVIFLDATANREKIALMYGLQPQEIYQIEAKKAEEKNLEIIQIKDLGKLCQERGKDQQKRLNLIIENLKKRNPDGTRIIDLKKFSNDACWWRDSRGRNQFQESQQLILVGTPARNLGQTFTSYLALGGKPHLFQKWYNQQIESDIIQGIGRIRSQIRPNIELKIILITNYELNFNTKVVKSDEICPEAAPKRERTINKIATIYQNLKNQQIKPSQKLIAEKLQLARETVNRLWKQVLKILEINLNPTELNPINQENLEEIIEQYANSMFQTYQQFFNSLENKDIALIIINILKKAYNPENPNLIKNILLRFIEIHGIEHLLKIEEIINSS